MSYTFTCDWCGGPIDGRAYIELRGRAGDSSKWDGGWVGHYHASKELDCYGDHIRPVLKMLHGLGQGLESIPTLSAEPARKAKAKTRPNRIAELRQAMGLTQSEVAQRLTLCCPASRIRQAKVSQWERGRADIPDEVQAALGELFGVSTHLMMRGES